ncbi:DUF6036 family nucleotidyltransferase [Rhizobium sp. BK176]|uniref:DUF6036 family nucleotidyltransferase n=1 Tax=Rhizobium sp. BK176 TaxID=2587071 RepID=UPI002169B4DF|nr:DUF6036 family nucleotidyltransferase [Rhizobium sp. BK176]MCS4088454.1 hypothetical protein [Rhizobium sp. BK176]
MQAANTVLKSPYPRGSGDSIEDARKAMLMKNKVPVRTVRDLDAAIRKVAEIFDTEAVVVVGSQAVLMRWGNKAPDAMRTSGEIDMYPANRKLWEEAERRKSEAEAVYSEASEYLHRIAGEGSSFDEIHGFYVDGVDETTSPLPHAWQERALYREVQIADGKVVTAVSPAIEDTLAAKMIRLRQKDIDFIRASYLFQPFDIDAMKRRLETIQPHATYTQEYLDGARANAAAFLDSLPKLAAKNPMGDLEKQLSRIVPDYPRDTHCAFYNLADNSVTIRKWDPSLEIYYKIDNPLGPAMVAKNFQHFVLDGKKVTKEAHDEQLAAGPDPDAPAPTPPPWRMAP